MQNKKIVNNHTIVTIVDNARTHTTRKYDLSILNKGEGTKCYYKTISFDDNGELKSIKCFKDSLSKGLFAICQWFFDSSGF